MATRAQTKNALAGEAWELLSAYFGRHRQRMLRVVQEFGISFGDMRALMVLDGERPRPMRELAGEWACDASNATWMVDRLEERGLVERRPMPGDRRVKAVVLTAKGEATKVELLARLAQPPEDLMALSKADLQALRDGLVHLPPDPST